MTKTAGGDSGHPKECDCRTIEEWMVLEVGTEVDPPLRPFGSPRASVGDDTLLPEEKGWLKVRRTFIDGR